MPGVYPVHNNIFKVNKNGRSTASLVTIADLENFSPSIDGNTEEWSPMDQAGWTRRAVTGKGLTISFSGKRNYGDPGNDYIAGLMLATGKAAESQFEWTLPNGGKLTGNCVINVTSPGGGDSTNIDTLEFEILSDGLPAYTAAGTLSTLTYTTAAGSSAGTTKVTTIAPTLTGGNSYVFKVGETLSSIAAGNVLLPAAGWQAYTLGGNITASAGQAVVIVEVDANGAAVKAGTAAAVVA